MRRFVFGTLMMGIGLVLGAGVATYVNRTSIKPNIHLKVDAPVPDSDCLALAHSKNVLQRGLNECQIKLAIASAFVPTDEAKDAGGGCPDSDLVRREYVKLVKGCEATKYVEECMGVSRRFPFVERIISGGTAGRCAALRLARENLTIGANTCSRVDVKYDEGLPNPYQETYQNATREDLKKALSDAQVQNECEER